MVLIREKLPSEFPLQSGDQPFGIAAEKIIDLGIGYFQHSAALGQLSGHPDEALKITLEIDDGTERRQFRPGEIRNMYSSLIRTHAASILAGTPLNAEKALHNQQCCIAASYSADNGGTEIQVDTVADR